MGYISRQYPGEEINHDDLALNNLLILDKIVCASNEFNSILLRAEKAAKTELPIHLEGESGVGKEVVAKYIHSNSSRAGQPFVPVNCGAIPDTLFEAEIFGYERGAFTNAFKQHKGYFEQANGGTIFLDEISEIPLQQQVKLLRILEDKFITRLGGESKISINVKVITATNQPLRNLVQQKVFRLDLYYRISIFNIYIQPLRERKDDILALVKHFVNKYNGDEIKLDNCAIDKLLSYSWQGNVRELESCVARAIINSSGKSFITCEDIELNNIDMQINNNCREEIENALSKTNGAIKRAAMLLGVHRNTIYNKIAKLKIDINQFRKK